MLSEILFLKTILALISIVFSFLLIILFMFSKRISELENKFDVLCDYLNLLIEYKSYYHINKIIKRNN